MLIVYHSIIIEEYFNMFKKFKKLDIPDQIMSRLQDNVDSAINQLPSIQPIQGLLLRNISLSSSGANSVSHKLGRRLVGWQVVRQRASAIIWDSQDSNTSDDLILVLNCSANVTIDLWVF